MNSKLMKLSFCVIAALLLAPSSWAAWSLDNDQSRLSFISIKATDIGEVHTFSRLAGSITDDGKVTVEINLASVETLIPIRNERMQEFLFDANVFPTATITASLDQDALQGLTPGTATPLDIAATLTIKERTVPLNAVVFAAKLDDDTVMVTSQQPVIVTAAGLGLSEGVEKLRELAGLPNISQAVPVSFVFTFSQPEG